MANRITAVLIGVLALGTAFAQAADPLASWNAGPAKQAIVSFVQATTDASSPQFVPMAQRIATFDQDGTLWVEHPMYTQVMYSLVRAGAGGEETGTEERRAVQDRAVGRSQRLGEALHDRF